MRVLAHTTSVAFHQITVALVLFSQNERAQFHNPVSVSLTGKKS